MSENSYANTYKNILILVCYLSLFNYGRRYIRTTYYLLFTVYVLDHLGINV